MLREERRLAHGLEHVEVVVAGGAVGAEAERDAGAQILRHRRGAARQLHVALGVVRHTDAAPLEDLDVLVGHPDPMGGQRPRTPEADRFQVADRRHLVLLARDADFVLGLRQVNDDRHAESPRELR